MTCNVGEIKRPIRIVPGMVSIGIGAFAGLLPVGTGYCAGRRNHRLVTDAIGFCPVWKR